ncbi:MAG TPA: STM3941 family protein [Acidimicrobiales bacterium]|nr:STM3941 family protein [Acidimicrobiales bacterium]
MRNSSPPHEVPVGGGRSQQAALLGTLAFVVFGIALAVAPGVNAVRRAFGILSCAFFGFLGVLGVIGSRRSDTVYVIADDGICFPRAGYPTVPWSRIEGLHIYWVVGQRFLAIDVTSPEELALHRGCLARWALRSNLRRGWGAIAISERLAPGTLEELAMEINRHRLTTGDVADAPTETPPSKARRFMGALRRPAALPALQGVLYLTSVSGAQTTSQGVRRVAFAIALLGGAILVARRPALGVPLVVTTEAVLVLLIMSLGHSAISVRILSLFFPVFVLLGIGIAAPHESGRRFRH